MGHRFPQSLPTKGPLQQGGKRRGGRQARLQVAGIGLHGQKHKTNDRHAYYPWIRQPQALAGGESVYPGAS